MLLSDYVWEIYGETGKPAPKKNQNHFVLFASPFCRTESRFQMKTSHSRLSLCSQYKPSRTI